MWSKVGQNRKHILNSQSIGEKKREGWKTWSDSSVGLGFDVPHWPLNGNQKGGCAYIKQAVKTS